MKKSLIALTLAALPVAAMADVTLYGQVKAGVEVSQTKVGTYTVVDVKERANRKSSTATEIADFGSRIGFKGHEHLGNNLNAIWQLEQSASIAGTDEGWGTRESFIGLEGNFGKIRAGKLDTVVKDSDDAIDSWEGNNNALHLGTFKRVSDREVSVRYDSPVFEGFSASVQYAPRDNQNPDDKHTHKTPSREAYFAGLNYENSGFFGQYAGGYRKNTNDNLKDGQVHRLTAGYDANNLLVAVSGQYTKNWQTYGEYAETLANGAVTPKNADSVSHAVFGSNKTAKDGTAKDGKGVQTVEVAATAAYRYGNVTPRISYAHGFKAKVDGENVKGTQYDQVILGADYDFSKRTTALVSAGWLRSAEDGPHKVQTVAGLVGLRHKF
ncbi:trimeric porin PorB [Neisseria animalis]|uniref:Porin n=1 Tax=Neisseria animalis TaxID=492 RepID=A0A5P3MRF1_NEIAN|nr:trimeric porin PorB [Neisseria animalis]QEY23655.1 porin [Neisseria animalis]ROW32800.1 porin [Neisseria animalis]VEE09433.1 porin [Neisseria animalis]